MFGQILFLPAYFAFGIAVGAASQVSGSIVKHASAPAAQVQAVAHAVDYAQGGK